MKKDMTNYDREHLPASRRAGFFSPWSNDYWEPSRWFDNFLNSDLSVFPTDNRFLSPAIDVDETADEFLVSADLPGIKKEDISIDCSGNQLTISAERKYDSEDGRKQGRRERFFGTYRRTFTLPTGVDSNKIEAAYEGGVLIVHIPKGEQVRSRRIQINEPTKTDVKKH
nr:Hsp20/alpha crystallin family protein [Bacteriovorax sp. HI3]